MADANEMNEMNGRIGGLEQRVDTLDHRITVVETTLGDMRAECRTGFSDLKTELNRIYDDRSKWGSWARDNIGTALKWMGWIILAACGITQVSSILKVIGVGTGTVN